VPVIEVDGQIIAQSKAVTRLACQASGLYYADNLTAAVAEGVVEAAADITESYVKIKYGSGTDEEKTKGVADWKAALPGKFADIKRNFAGVYFIGTTPTMADIAVFALLRMIEAVEPGAVKASLSDFVPLVDALNRHPAVVKYDLKHAKFKLTYFDVAGRADAARLSFLLGGVKFEDVRFDEKTEDEDLGKLKAAGVLPYGQVPVLEVNGKFIAQSKAIARLAAQAAGLYFDGDAVTESIGESVVEAAQDIYEELSKIRWRITDAAEKAAAIAKAKETFGAKTELIKKLYSGTFFLGTKISYADVAMFQMFRIANFLDNTFLDAAPEWKEFFTALSTNPAVAEYDRTHNF